jgi:hypothetical protein
VPTRHAFGADVVVDMTLVSLFWSTACSARDKVMQYNHISCCYHKSPGASDASGAVDRTSLSTLSLACVRDLRICRCSAYGVEWQTSHGFRS